MQTVRQPVVYTVFVLRCWSETDSEKPWRFSLESPRTRVQRGFDNLESLIIFLESQLQLDAKEEQK